MRRVLCMLAIFALLVGGWSTCSFALGIVVENSGHTWNFGNGNDIALLGLTGVTFNNVINYSDISALVRSGTLVSLRNGFSDDGTYGSAGIGTDFVSFTVKSINSDWPGNNRPTNVVYAIYDGSSPLVFGFDGKTATAGISAETFPGFPSPVPEPSTLLLIGTGLVSLAGFGRKFRR